MNAAEQQPHWSEQKERGSFFALRFMLFLYRCGGKWICRLLVYPIVLYFFLTGTRARRASRKYLTRLYHAAPDHAGLARPPGTRDVLRHFIEFGTTCIDRLDAWTGCIKRTDVIWPNRQVLIDQARAKQGGVLIGTHLGCMDLLRGVASQLPDLKINALVFIDHAQHFNRMFRIANPGITMQLISVKSFTPDVALMLADKVEKGEFVVVLADRIPAGARDRVEWIPFLGHDAPWPTGPMLLASLMNCPVFLIFCLRKTGRQYEVYLEHFENENLALPRKSRRAALQGAIDRHARVVERYCGLAPYQWFNFYDFWADRHVDGKQDDRTR